MEFTFRTGLEPKPEPTEVLGQDGRTYQQYLDERRLLVDAQKAAGDSFDKVLLTLAAGAIVVSVTFAEKLGSAGAWKPLLYTSWLLFALSLISNLRGFILLIASLSRSLSMNDELWVTGSCATDDPFAGKIMALNNVSFWLFCAGVSVLLLFAGRNYQLNTGQDNTNTKAIVIMADKDGTLRKIFEGELKKTSPAPPVVKVPNDRPGTGSDKSSADKQQGKK